MPWGGGGGGGGGVVCGLWSILGALCGLTDDSPAAWPPAPAPGGSAVAPGRAGPSRTAALSSTNGFPPSFELHRKHGGEAGNGRN